jgi:two-component system CheB/CheR fusion protein
VVSDHFLDGMPLGLDGIVRIRQDLGRPDLPAILLTGDVGVQISRSTQEMGIILINKPVSPEALLGAIARLLAADSVPNTVA